MVPFVAVALALTLAASGPDEDLEGAAGPPGLLSQPTKARVTAVATSLVAHLHRVLEVTGLIKETPSVCFILIENLCCQSSPQRAADPAGIALTLTPYLAILRNGLRPASMDYCSE